MKKNSRMFRFWAAVVAAVGGLVVLSGCGATGGTKTTTVPAAPSLEAGESESRLRAGDQLQIRVETSPNVAPQVSEVTVDDEGYVALPLIGRQKALGLSTSELAERIQKAYVPQYYVRCTATVQAPVRYFYIGGEVKNPNRFPWSKDMTLLKAISTASGFSDFANRNKVEIARGRTKLVYDSEDIRRHPEKDVAIQPGDSIYVPRTIF